MAVLTPTAKMQFVGLNGQPLTGGKLYTYAAGTTTPVATYMDNNASVANPNPVILDARGEASVWLDATTYKFKLTDSNDVEIWTVDYISAPITSVSPVLSGNVTISSDSSSPALKITQTGTGPVLRVQDSLDPDTTPFIINSDGYVGIGTAAPTSALEIDGGTFQISLSAAVLAKILADASNTYLTAEGSRSLVFKTNNVTRTTINDTAITSTVPLILPGVPTISSQATTKGYVDLADFLTLQAAAPPGAVMSYAGTSAPSGWLLCDGSAISRTGYANLFSAIGSTWGSGDGVNTFNIPDLRGMFLRGTGTNGTIAGAVGPSVGVYGADTYLNHNHTATSTDSGHGHSYTAGGSSGFAYDPGFSAANSSNPNAQTTGTGNANITTTVATSTTGGAETKPKNYGVLYIIKT
jgi:microcystin-dependent protein